ncbi:MAG TPA: hypothetical protein VI757_07475 [Bacteroidia bacterium]|nr:hypothetical protein [Bacteroidia bacterium]
MSEQQHNLPDRQAGPARSIHMIVFYITLLAAFVFFAVVLF